MFICPAQIEGWDVAHQLLSLNSDTEYVNYFAANTMHSKVLNLYFIRGMAMVIELG